jgi:predicted transcriptional regulator
MSYTALAKILRLSPKTTSNYANGRSSIPYCTELAIRRMVEDVERGAVDVREHTE